MNVLPTSVNLLGRYYTGLGAKNLDFKDKYKQDLGTKVKDSRQLINSRSRKNAMFGIKSLKKISN